MSNPERPSDAELVARMVRGETGSLDAFRSRHQTLVLQICLAYCHTAGSAGRACDAFFAAPDLSWRLAGYNGRSKFSTFSLVVIKRFLFERLVRLIQLDAASSMPEFQAFFRRSFTIKLEHRIQNEALREDASQWVGERMVRDDCAQLIAWAAEAEGPGFIIKKFGLLVKDFLNSRDAPSGGRKPNMPEAVKRLDEFDQEVFEETYWRSSSIEATVLALRHRYPDTDEAAVIAARVRVDQALGPKGRSGAGKLIETSIEANPKTADLGDRAEETRPDNEHERIRFVQAVLAAAASFPREERLYLLKFLEGKPARVIATEMRLPAAEVYKLPARVFKKLRKLFLLDPAAKNYRASVLGDEPDEPAESAPSPDRSTSDHARTRLP